MARAWCGVRVVRACRCVVTASRAAAAQHFDGNVRLDALGQATVVVDERQAARCVDGEWRYALCPIGRFVPLFVAQEVSGGAFRISGGHAGCKVSWTLIGLLKPAP